MSAANCWPLNEPQDDDSCSSMNNISVVAPESSETAAFRRLDPAPLEMFQNDDTLGRLLQAVESTNIAMGLQVSEQRRAVSSNSSSIEARENASNVLTFTRVVTNQKVSNMESEAEHPIAVLRSPVQSSLPRPVPVETLTIFFADPI